MLGILFALLLANLKQRKRSRILCHEHVAHVRSQSVDEVAAVESLLNDRVEQQHYVAHLVLHSEVDDAEVVVGIKLVEVLNDLLVCDVALAEACSLVEYGQGVAHTAVCLLGNHAQSFFLVGNALLLCNVLKVRNGVLHRHALEVVYLATR